MTTEPPPSPDASAELAALRGRVERLEAESDLHSLRNRFHEFVNTDRFFAAIPRLLPAGDGAPFVRQFIHGHDVTVDGDTATGTSFLFATPVYHGTSFVLAGRFADSYVRRDGTWLFSSVTLEVYYSVPLAEGWAGPDRHRMRL